MVSARVFLIAVSCLVVFLPSSSAACPRFVASVPASCNASQYSKCGANAALRQCVDRMVAGKPVTQCSPFGTDGVDSVTAGTCFPCSHAAVKLAGYLCTDGETRLCPGGNYCPLNTTTGSYNVAIPCDVEGKICLPGFIAPVECRPGQLCKANATKIERSWGWLVAVLFITIVMCCMCCCVRFYSVREAPPLTCILTWPFHLS